jgi:hypothetical protein
MPGMPATRPADFFQPSLQWTRVLVAFACLAFGATGAARAASFDCARARAPVERKICADRGLSAADSNLEHVFDAALLLTFDPAELRSQQTLWLTQTRDKAQTVKDIAEVYAKRRMELDEMLARLRAMEPGRILEAAKTQPDCLPVLAGGDDHTCRAIAYGDIGAAEGRAFSYATYEYTPKEIGFLSYRRIVVFERLVSGLLRAVLAPDANPSYYPGAPRLLRSGDRLLLQLPSRESGTANSNVERLFVWRGERWRDVDITIWLDKELGTRLPAGVTVENGVYPDYVALKAATPLWRDRDDVECPTGGRVEIALAWRDERIALKNFRFVKARECGASPDAR